MFVNTAIGMDAQNVLNALPGAVLLLDGRGNIQQHNPAAADWFDEPLQGIPWREVIRRCFCITLNATTDLRLHDGRILTLLTRPLGKTPGQLLLFQDVTENRQLQTQLQQHQRLIDMGRMAASLAHQIRTPLSAALLYASQLRHPGLDCEKRQRFTERTVSSLQQLESLIANMLHFSRGGICGEEDFSASNLLQALRNGTTEQAHDPRIRWQDENGTCMMRGNRSLLLSAWQNLLTNALQAANDNTRITVFCRQLPNQVMECGVHDTGPGISEEMQRRLFEPFHSSRERGTGLGLAVARSVARAHHGEIHFESKPGDTTFTMRLPALPSGTAAKDLPATAAGK